MLPAPTPVRLRIEEVPRTLRELALERLRTAIVELHFKPGQRLTERDLCGQLGVSRSVVREVIRHLETEGLVTSVPHHGPTVARLDRATAAQIYEVRGLLESIAAGAAAQSASWEDIARLGAALDDIRAAYAGNDHHGVISATSRFYDIMFRSGGKTVALDMAQRLNSRISLLRAMTITSPGRALSGPGELERIHAAIAARNPAEAERACRDHVAKAAAIADQLLSAEDEKD